MGSSWLESIRSEVSPSSPPLPPLPSPRSPPATAVLCTAQYFAEDLDIPSYAEASWTDNQARLFFESGGVLLPEYASAMEECHPCEEDEQVDNLCGTSLDITTPDGQQLLEDVAMRVAIQPPQWFEVIHHLVYERDAPSTAAKRLRYRSRGTSVRARARCGEWLLIDEDEAHPSGEERAGVALCAIVLSPHASFSDGSPCRRETKGGGFE